MRVLRWPGHVLRAFAVGLVVLLCALVYGIGRLGTLFIRDRERRAAAVGRLRGRVLRRAMVVLGATFIKMGQVMSTRPDLLSDGVIAELRKLQDQLPPFAYWRARRIVEADLGAPIDELFGDFDRAPIAAASVAQVHRAELADGTEVAVKVLRPGIRGKVERDGAILLFGARLLALHPKARLSDPVGHTRHFVQAIIDQTDLTIEARNNQRFRANFAAVTDTHFPALHAELCSERVLTMELVRGVKVDALPPGNHVEVARKVRMAILKMCFEDGFLHADMHPGNMVVMDDGRLGIFDLGMAKLLGADVLDQFIDISKCLSMGTSDDLVGHLQRFHTYLDGVDWESLRRDVDAFGERFRNQATAEFEYATMLGEMFALGRRYDVRPVTDMMMVFVALITAQGIGKQLNPGGRIFDEVAMYLLPILHRRGESIPDTDEARAARDRRDGDDGDDGDDGVEVRSA